MFVAMNRFRINPALEEEFVETWRQRESYLDEVPGFRSFALLKGPPIRRSCFVCFAYALGVERCV